jgi:VWFA-related protein
MLAVPGLSQEKPPVSVVSVSLSLVQVDAVVNDKDGRPVTDLAAKDFEIFQDGRKQEITHVAYVAGRQAPAPGADHTAPAAPSEARTITILVDDYRMSLRSAVQVRDALRRFVDAQMQPGDRVAIVRTGASPSSLEFQSDKTRVAETIERIQFHAGSRAHADAPLAENTLPSPISSITGGIDRMYDEIRTEGTLETLGSLVNVLRGQPGRKSIVFFSDGMSFADPARDMRDVPTVFRDLTEFATRSSVVLYTVDARGLSTLALDASDDLGGADAVTNMASSDLANALHGRSLERAESQHALYNLAHATGGLFLRNPDLSRALGQALDDQNGYYLIGYTPDASSFRTRGTPAFHKIKVKVLRDGLSVRSRAGFYGVPDEAPAEKPQSREPKGGQIASN